MSFWFSLFEWAATISFGLTILCFVIAVLGIFIDTQWDLCPGGAFGGLICLTAGFIFVFIALIVAQPLPYTMNISSLGDGDGLATDGNFFFLGGGQVGSSLYYVVLEDTPQGTRKVMFVSDDNSVYVVEDATAETAYVDYWVYEGQRLTSDPDCLYKAVIHVPNGTIVRDYSMGV